MSTHFRKGSQVKWKWGSGYGHGKVVQKYTRKVTLTIKGAEITRDATAESPAYKIKQEDGDFVLKGESELQSE